MVPRYWPWRWEWELPFCSRRCLGGYRWGWRPPLALFWRATHGPNYAEHSRDVVAVLAAAATSAVAAAIVAEKGCWTDLAMIALACFAATVGGYSRPLAVGTGRFIAFFVLTLGIMDAIGDPSGLLVLMAAGAAWTSFLSLVLGGLLRTIGWVVVAVPEPGSSASAAQKFTHWKRTLQNLAGWQYAIRLALSLGLAGFLRWQWPEHHLHWIALTVVILCHRRLEALPVKVTQRAVGASLGVAATSLLIFLTLPGWILACAVALLAGLGVWLRTQNYLAYTASMTPLIILLFDAGRPVCSGILIDRLIATLIGAVVVVTANMLTGKLVHSRSR